MIRRAVDPRFSADILEGRKFTTIRKSAWPVDVPIMLFNWAGVAYRSPQKNLAVVRVQDRFQIDISRNVSGRMAYTHDMLCGAPLWWTEGFNGSHELDDWFRPLVKPGCVVTMFLMAFKVQSFAVQEGGAK